MRMTTEKIAPVQDYDVQPGQVVVIAAPPEDPKILHVFLPEPWRRRAMTDQPSVALVPGVATLVDARVFAGPDGAKLLKSGVVQIVDEPRGVLPETLDLSDNARRAVLRDGHPSPPKQQQLEWYRQKYVEWSLGSAIYECVQAGIPEDEAASVLVKVCDESFVTGGSRSQPWLARSVEMIAAHRAREAGLA
jgi:hypothetical protein